MSARQLTKAQIQAWKIQGRTPGKRTELFNAEWETLCELAIQALDDTELIENFQLELLELQAKQT
jgi:hypothetical protein